MVNWIQQDDGSLCKSTNNSQTVGMKISTKSVGRDEREDITHNYKYPEGRCPAAQSLGHRLAERQRLGARAGVRVVASAARVQ